MFLEDENKRLKLDDLWQINYIVSTANEHEGYPTQKHEALLERIT